MDIRIYFIKNTSGTFNTCIGVGGFVLCATGDHPGLAAVFPNLAAVLVVGVGDGVENLIGVDPAIAILQNMQNTILYE